MDIKALATTATEVGIKIIIALIVMLIAFAIINKIGNSLEELWLNLRYGQFRNIGKSIARRLRKWTGTYHHA